MTINYTIENSRENIPTLSVETDSGRKYIHSRHFPSKESTNFPDLPEDEGCVTIILGLGLGYHLSGKKFTKTQNYILLDIISEIDSEAIKINPFLKQENIHIFTGNTDKIISSVNGLLKSLSFTKVNIIEHTASIRIFPAEYSLLKTAVTDIISSIASNTVTKNAFSGIYMRNILRRFHDIENMHPVSSLENIFINIPALIISSAPSLDGIIPEIKKNTSKMILIAVDSALPALIINGIIPDVVISIDPQPWITEHLRDCAERFILIESISSYNTGLKQEKFISLNSHPLSQVIEHFFPGKTGSIDSGSGTVAGDAAAAAELMGCSPIIFSGMDFSFPGFSIYARGTSYQRRFTEIFSTRLRNAETFNADYIFRKSKAYKYNEINSRKSFIDYRNRINSFLQNRKLKYFHICPGKIPLKAEVINNCSQIINNFDSIDKDKKTSAINAISDMILMKELVDIRQILSFIGKNEIFNEICRSSEISDIQKISKLKKMQEKLCALE